MTSATASVSSTRPAAPELPAVPSPRSGNCYTNPAFLVSPDYEQPDAESANNITSATQEQTTTQTNNISENLKPSPLDHNIQ